MVCRPIKLLICWLLMTSPSMQDAVTKTTIPINFTNTEITLKRSASSHSGLSGDSLLSAKRLESSTDGINTQLLSTTNSSYPDDVITANTTGNYDNGRTSSSPITSPAATIPVHLRGDGLVSSEDYERITYVINVVIIPLMLVGIFTNLLTVVVYLRMPRSVTSTFFCMTTVLDVVFLLSGLPSTVMYLTLGEGQAMRNKFYLTYGIYVSNYVTNTLRKVLVSVTMMLSLDRCLMVSFPLRMKLYDHLRRPKLYTLVISVLAFLLDINVLFRYKIMESTSSSNGTDTHHVLLTTDLYNSHKQMFFDMSLISNVVFKYIPLTILVVSNILLVVNLARHSRQLKIRLDEGTYRMNVSGNDQGKRFSKNETVQTEVETFGEREQPAGFFSISDNSLRMTTVTADSFKDQSDTGSIRLTQGASYPGQDKLHAESLGEMGSSVTTRLATHRIRKLFSLKSDRQHSMTVLIYSVIFTFLALPNTVYPLLRKIIPGFFSFGRHHFLVLTLNNVYFLLDTTSSAINFFVYFLTGSAFRAGVFALFAKLRCPK